MQDRSSTRPTLRLKKRSDNAARNFMPDSQIYNQSALPSSNLIGLQASFDFAHKNPDLNLTREPILSSAHPPSLSCLNTPECISSKRNKPDSRSNRLQNHPSTIPFNSHITKSGLMARSNSTDYEKDSSSNLSMIDIVGRGPDLNGFFVPAVSLDAESMREKQLSARAQSSISTDINTATNHSNNLHNNNILEFEQLFQRLELSPTNDAAACIANLR